MYPGPQPSTSNHHPSHLKAQFIWIDKCLPPREPSARIQPAQYHVRYSRVRLVDEEAAFVVLRKQTAREVQAVGKAKDVFRSVAKVAAFKRDVG